jgi:hypothetical protein
MSSSHPLTTSHSLLVYVAGDDTVLMRTHRGNEATGLRTMTIRECMQSIQSEFIEYKDSIFLITAHHCDANGIYTHLKMRVGTQLKAKEELPEDERTAYLDVTEKWIKSHDLMTCVDWHTFIRTHDLVI